MHASDFFARHQKAALLFSGGKDSVACLWLLQPYWPQLDVVWVNSGNVYPETIAYMQEIRALVPSFHEVASNQPAFIREYGYPIDWAPSITAGPQHLKLVPAHNCCATNLWLPALRAVKSLGVTGVIRGQRSSDSLKAPVQSGAVVDGLEYYHPVEDWTEADIRAYLGDRIPPAYKRGRLASLDCLNCTAYVSQDPGRVEELRRISPESYDTVVKVHKAVKAELQAFSEKLHG